MEDQNHKADVEVPTGTAEILAEAADVIVRLTAALTRNGHAHLYPALMLDADRAVVRAAGALGVKVSNGGQQHE